MPNPALQRLLKKLGNENLIAELNVLSLSELNSVMLEIFRQRSQQRSPASLMRAFSENRFVRPSAVNAIEFMEMEIDLLRLAMTGSFQPIVLSPLTPLGTCSAVALADQNKIISALRGTEAVADATNVLALLAARERIRSGFNDSNLHYCANHRHVRGQSFSGKGFSAHFGIFCAISSGRDTGAFTFEKEAVLKHLKLYVSFLKKIQSISEIRILLIKLSTKNTPASAYLDDVIGNIHHANVLMKEVPAETQPYYSGLRFSINAVFEGQEYNLGDGGFVDWPFRLTGNRKEKMLTSGLGTEFLFKLSNGIL